MLLRLRLGLLALLCACTAPVFSFSARAQDAPAVQPPVTQAPAPDDHARGRKYKAPPATSNVEIEVVKAANGKPIMNAAVIFHPEKDGKDEGNLEVKTDPDGKAKIDVLPIGSTVTVQVIASGFATFAEEIKIASAEQQINIRMLRPRAQVSTYVDNQGKPAQTPIGVQEPNHPAPPANTPATGTKPATAVPPSTAPPAPATPPSR